jgi:hypothetical protein
MLDPPKRWRTPEELVEIGFARSRVVMVNEAHNGLLRSVSCRRIGARLLPAAHAAGVRHLAMEALYPKFAAWANTRRIVPRPSTMMRGYLAQPEMLDLIAAALELGWTLVPYEADDRLQPSPGFAHRSWEHTNWREDEQAKNLAGALAGIDKLLVWCGNGHHSKRRGDEWIPMGVHFIERAGFEAFAIDQTRAIRFDDKPRRLADWADAFADQIGEGAGFLVDERPEGWPDVGADAFIVSTEHDLT